MTPIADMIERLIGGGCAPTMAAVVVAEAIEYGRNQRDASRHASRDEVIPNRSPAAIRAARYRENRKQNQLSAEANDAAKGDFQPHVGGRDASRDGVTSHCNLTSLLPVLEANRGSEESKKEVSARARGTRLSPDWQPDETLRQFARDHNVDPDQLRAEFVDFWIGVPGVRGTKTNWPATWRNRVRAVQTHRNGKNGQTGNVIAAADRLLERVRAFDKPAPSGIRDGTGQADVRLLPEG